MKVAIKKWGNSAAVRLPTSLMESFDLTLDQIVNLREENGYIVMEPVREKEYDLDSMLAAITPENRHESVDYGPAVGKEAF